MINTFACEILSFLLVVSLFCGGELNSSREGYFYWWVGMFHRLLLLFVSSLVVMILREHLMLWAIFTPKVYIKIKYMYEKLFHLISY